MFEKQENVVEVEGYLKDNTLAYDNGNLDVIKGNVVIATETGEEHRLQYYVTRYKKPKDGKPAEKNSNFEFVEKMLADNTTSFAKIVKSNPTATFEENKENITKIYARGEFNEYLRLNREGSVDSSVTLRGSRLYPRTADKFNPRAVFSVKAYVESMKNEVKNSEETGRLILNCLIPNFSNGVCKIDFIASNETFDVDGRGTMATMAQFVEAVFAPKDTISISGDLVNLRVETTPTVNMNDFFGRREIKPRVEFVNERIIRGGNGKPIHQGEKECYSIEDVKEACALREKKVDEVMKETSKPSNNVGGFSNNSSPRSGFGNISF